ncbi:uncharacterized protein LOC124258043 isoform X2 [Haliotis rubra]|uniref:uncharacterized protein LOC124258043 isoform X2 n=1 Tax=Haliotis rubra TaxID=36100 RepID=UPI001EE57DD5|nr:uncharacterized protein LOC124258043 isoform X2 [Haliotis rubra]
MELYRAWCSHVYIVPGLIGLMATCCRAKGGYIAQMVFCILTLLAMGIFVVVALLALTGIGYANKSCDDALDDLCTGTARRFFAVLYSIIDQHDTWLAPHTGHHNTGRCAGLSTTTHPRNGIGANEHSIRGRRQSDDERWMDTQYGNTTNKPRISSRKILALLLCV